MPPRKAQTPASRSAGAKAQNPFSPKEDAVLSVAPAPNTPMTLTGVPPAAPMPEFRAHGHVLTERGWVREQEGKTDG